jgi:hypothetical protein
LEASCADCADVTHRFERDALHGIYPALRAVLAFQTRRKKERPTTLPLVIQEGNSERVVDLPLSEYPVYLPSPLWLEPGVVVGRARNAPVGFTLKLRHLAGPTFEDVAERFQPCSFAGMRLSFAPPEFARMIAKVAFCAAVYAIGIEPLRESPIRGVILGKDPAVGHWVGAWNGAPNSEASGLHAMKLRSVGPQLHVFVRLFAQFGAPEYHVVLGDATPDFVASDQWPWK